MNSIQNKISGRYNNFDAIRFFAAALVIFSHAFPLSGYNKSEPLTNFSNGQTTFGHLGVLIFFIISGFLISQSFDRSRSSRKFVIARVLRIFPALIVVVVLSVLVLGLTLSKLTPLDYFTDSNTYNYLKAILLFPMQYTLPGVFTENPYPDAVNGSLWTLPIEFLFYFVVLFLGVFKFLNKTTVIALFLISLISPYMHFPIGESYIDLFRFFVAGVFFYMFKENILLKPIYALTSLIAVVFSMKFGLFNIIFPMFGSYLIFYLAFNDKVKMHSFSKYGDFSYGLYIYAFPIQQVVSYLLKNEVTPLTNFLVSFPMTMVFAFLSWHYVEKPSINLKNKNLKMDLSLKSLRQYY